MKTLENKTVVITAGNRGGGLCLSKKFADHGANVVVIAEKSDPLHSIEFSKLIIPVDFDNEKDIICAVEKVMDQLGTLDILINNFSAFNFKNSLETTPEMFGHGMKNIFSTFFFSKTSAPHLAKSANPHIINISPPIIMEATKEACAHHLLFSISKYGMSFCTMGMAEEFKALGIAVNSLWQARPIATKTLIENFNDDLTQGSNRPEVYAEAAYLISLKPAKEFSGRYCIDEDILREAGIDPTQYAINPNTTPVVDIFLPGVNYKVFSR